MKEKTSEMDMSMWLSTYGLVTASRILERFQINLSQEQLSIALKNTYSIYYKLLHIPLKNVFNGIIYQQVYDYQVYAQKLFVEYLLSSEQGKDADSAGANTRDDLEIERQTLEQLNEQFETETRKHQALIAQSQAALIKISKELQESFNLAIDMMEKQALSNNRNKLQQALSIALIYQDRDAYVFWKKLSTTLVGESPEKLEEKLPSLLTLMDESRVKVESIQAAYLDRGDDVNIALRGCRSDFYNLILRTVEYLKLLPDYQFNEERDLENRASLYFNASFGE